MRTTACAPIYVVRITDGVEQNRKHPYTFAIPTPESKNTLQVGDSVKIKLEWEPGCPIEPGNPESECHGEGFWVTIIAREGHAFTGKVDNETLFPQVHGFVLADEIAFTADHILLIIF